MMLMMTTIRIIMMKKDVRLFMCEEGQTWVVRDNVCVYRCVQVCMCKCTRMCRMCLCECACMLVTVVWSQT